MLHAHMKRAPLARRRSVNLTIRADLMEAARELGLNASRTAEAAIAGAVERARAERWLKENRAAVEAHNRRVETAGALLATNWAREDR